MGTHSATTTLDDIIDELRLKYDSSVGLLDGNAIREIPNLNILLNLNKLLTNLSKNLTENQERDSELLKKVELKIELLKLSEEGSEAEVEEDENKREREENDIEEESIPLAKRRKHSLGAQMKLEDEEVEEQEAESEALQEKPIEPEEEEEEEVEEAENDIDQGVDASIDEPEALETQPESQINTKFDPVPPVQIGSFTQENDTRLKNPKSEFVTSQSLSADTIAELGLFSDDNNGLETQGKEYLKKKFGVASYPENDLKDLLPGEIPDIDFSKNKPPSNQVQFSTYQSYIESYFRPFSNDDISFANEKFVIPPGFEKLEYDPNVSPYLIVKLGAFYADVWAEEDAALRSKLSSPAAQKPPLESYKPKGEFEELDDDKMLSEDVSCGPLSSRLLSAVLSIHEAKKDGTDDDDDRNEENSELDSLKKEDSLMSEVHTPLSDDVATQLDSGDTYKLTSEVNDFYSMEERLKRELKYIGIFMNLPDHNEDKPKKGGNIIDSDDWILNREDDEVCAEIRTLQEELKEAVVRNRQRKKPLIPIIEEQLAYQEYCTILEDLDKQVDQAYVKRLKAKSKKKKTPEITNTAQQQAANSGLRALLDKRRRWIENIGKLFKPAQIMKRIPTESIFKPDEQSDEEDGDAEDDVVNEEERLATD